MIPAILAVAGPLIDKALDFIPNQNERARAKEQMESAVLAAANTAQELQLKINLAEAGHRSVFVAGWRPFIGWVCGLGFLWEFLAYPLLNWAALSGLMGADIAIPVLPTNGNLLELTLGMLGMGALRSWEKSRGIATTNITTKE